MTNLTAAEGLSKKKLVLILTLVVLIVTPLIGLLFAGNGIPKDFFDFPKMEAPEKPPTSILVIIILSLLFFSTLLLIFVPRLFGFRPPVNKRSPVLVTKAGLPWWFWVGGAAWLVAFVFLSAKIENPKWFNDWLLVPLWWGSVLVLDGIVYYRQGGKSMISSAPKELISMSMASISGWLIFEYYNLFIGFNWYYSHAYLISKPQFDVYAIIGSSVFIPMCFEWYQLLRTVPGLSVRYESGPKLDFPNWLKVVLLILSVAGLFACYHYPAYLFFVIWASPLIILGIVLGWLGIYTPFQPVKNGDWSALIVFSCTFLLMGILVEWWNHAGAVHSVKPPTTFNPSYWQYSLPYVNVARVFEMPLLGYYGYFPFSIYCFLWFNALAVLFGTNTAHAWAQKFR